MASIVNSLVPISGELYGHLFENEHTGLVRDVFWSVEVAFEPMELLGERWPVSIQIEWLSWPIRRWTELDRRRLVDAARSGSVESSIYFANHHQPFSLKALMLRRLEAFDFLARFEADFVIEDPDGERHGPMNRLFEVPVRFAGVYVLPENLPTKPISADDAKHELGEFLRVDDFHMPVWDRFRFVFKPRADAS